jgi:serine beta-lactamase-like protein LACTB, mitochondrial
MHPRLTSALFLLVLSACSAPADGTGVVANAAIAPEPRDAAAMATSRAAAQQFLAATGTPGVAVAVVRAGEIVWTEAFGVADVDTKVPASTATRFGIGSITKAMTMAVAGKLVDAGKLDFDAPLETWLPDFPHRGKGISLRLVAGHLSGYEDRFGSDLYWSTRRFRDTGEVLAGLYAEPLAAAPGERHQYGTATYMLIAAAIERATGKSYLDAVRQLLLEPLGLKDTVPNDNLVADPHRSSFHGERDGATVRVPATDPSHKWAGAGYVATASDVAKFGSAMLGPDLLTAATRCLLFRTLRTTAGDDTGFALGWRVGTDDRGDERIIQPGGGPGFAALITLHPRDGGVVVVLANKSRVDLGELAATLRNAFRR